MTFYDEDMMKEVLLRYTRRSWFRTFSLVGLLTVASVLQPWFLFSSSEVVLPVAGAVLTIFVAVGLSVKEML